MNDFFYSFINNLSGSMFFLLIAVLFKPKFLNDASFKWVFIFVSVVVTVFHLGWLLQHRVPPMNWYHFSTALLGLGILLWILFKIRRGEIQIP